ncbi:MAG: hypothetical protein QW692_04260 [Nitrososphaerota archaeon]
MRFWKKRLKAWEDTRIMLIAMLAQIIVFISAIFYRASRLYSIGFWDKAMILLVAFSLYAVIAAEVMRKRGYLIMLISSFAILALIALMI